MEHKIALSLGMPVNVMKNILTTPEYNRWVAYYKYKTPDETEIQLAVIGLSIAQGLGSKKAKFNDYLINKQHNGNKKEEVKTAFDSFSAIATDYKGGGK